MSAKRLASKTTQCPTKRWALMTLGLLLFAGSMSSCQQSSTHKDSQRTPVEAAPWICTFGSEGGFTGGGSGYEIHSTGQILTWSQVTPQHPLEKQEVGHASEEQLEPLSIALQTPGLQSIRFAQSGNLTTFLEVTRQGHKQRWSWAAGSAGDRTPKIPELVRDCFEAAQAIARQVDSTR